MTCPELFKVSLRMDGELPPAQEAQLRTHLADCRECGQAWQDFTALRRQMQAVTAGAANHADDVLKRILSPSKPGFWRRRIAVPAPLAAAAALLLAALAVWTATMRPGQTTLPPLPSGLEAQFPSHPEGFDLARFDQGGRALIFKQPKPGGRLR
ncbi:MAG: zf-HC2 domain-containing protein [Acidobacteriota bacterium]